MKKTTKQALFALLAIFICIILIGAFQNKSTTTNSNTNQDQSIVISVTGLDLFQFQGKYDCKNQNVYEVLVALANENHFELKTKGFGDMIYISSINQLAEFDYGNRSGWMYKVNDVYPNVGCASYDLKEGDKIEWIYVTE